MSEGIVIKGNEERKTKEQDISTKSMLFEFQNTICKKKQNRSDRREENVS